jgi:hypothetical protein
MAGLRACQLRGVVMAVAAWTGCTSVAVSPTGDRGPSRGASLGDGQAGRAGEDGGVTAGVPAIPGGAGDAGGRGLGPTAPSADGPNCGLTRFAVERLPPNVLIVLDKSASMNQLAQGLIGCLFLQCNSKWTDMKNALTSTVTATQATINWGLKLFPTDDMCGVSDGITTPVAANNASMVNAAIAANNPAGLTPTRFAIEGAGRYLMGLPTPNPRYVVLATDGLPNCGGQGDQADDAATIMAVANLAAAGIPVYVIGVGTLGDGDATLSAMARAGGKPRTANPAYYPVTTSADLSAALSAIGGQIISCTLPIKQPPDPSNIAVEADGARVPRSGADGWEYGPGMTTIQLSGSWCARYQDGTIKDVQTVFGCPGVIIQ